MKRKELVRRRKWAHHAKQRRADKPTRPAGVEREIKFEIPQHTLAALVAEMSSEGDDTVTLHAVYQDFPGRELARAGVALRVRREGDLWIQTLKAPGAHALERVEDEVVLGPATEGGAPPAADLARHVSRAAQAALRSAIDPAAGPGMPAVHPVFEVKVLRRRRKIRHGASLVEIALDEGELLAAGRKRPVHELELELVEGHVGDLLALARIWRQRWDLCLNTASKAARGNRLASGNLFGPAVGASAPRLPAKVRMGEFTAAVLDACLAQVMGNASEIAGGGLGDEHVHQLRVGLRRLRTALRDLPSLAVVRGQVETVLVDVFRGLGERRDRTHVLRTIQPLIQAAGGKPLRIPAAFHEGADPGELVRSSDFQDAILRLLASAERARSTPGDPVKRTLRPQLAKLHKQVTQEGRHFTRLSEDDQHSVRKRLKRLRYLSEFVAPLYPRKDVQRYVSAIKPAQEALGQYNDEIMAQGLYEELSATEPSARFGVQWLQSRRESEARACRKSLRKLNGSRPFWEKD